MRAAMLSAPYSIDVVAHEEPEPRQGEVVLRVLATSICGTDISAYRGVHPRIKPPSVLGHEVAGEVAAVGPGADPALLGAVVCAEPNICCGTCRYCRAGLPNICPEYRVLGDGSDLPGGLAEFVAVPAAQVFRLPEGLSAIGGSIVQPLAVCYEGVIVRAAVGDGERVLIVGAGPIGLGSLMLARQRGAQVMVTDVVPDRLEMARQLGAEVTVPAGDDVDAAVRDWTHGVGVDVAIEAAGGAQTESLALAHRVTAPRGRILVLGAFAEKTFPFAVGDLKTKEQTVIGSHGHPRTFAPVLDLIADGRLDASALVTHHLGLDQSATAFDLLDRRLDGVMKVVISP
ncbi:MAG TPA: alcohol dehydrogenase catalytic domain-containing protein [Microbacterium sp.]|nr:alcohol dehydrogenase catalytic domain-containing protein [Microbacterium sp.]